MSADREGAIRALEPFAKAFEEFGRWRYTDHEKKDEWFAFQDKNIVTPTMTMGDFRKAADTFASLTASKEAPAPVMPVVSLDRIEQVFIDHGKPHDMDFIRAIHTLQLPSSERTEQIGAAVEAELEWISLEIGRSQTLSEGDKPEFQRHIEKARAALKES